MRDFPSCFGENGVQVADYSSSSSSSSSSAATAQNVVTCLYQCRIRGRSCLITVAWSRSLIGQGLTITIEDHSSNQCLCKVEIKPWLFTKRKGSRNMESIDIFWDLSSAKFGSGPEPQQGFYVAVLADRKMVLLLGDLRKEAYKKTTTVIPNQVANSIFVAKKEHIFGKKVFSTRAQFCNEGPVHDLVLECDTIGDVSSDPCLSVRVDCKTVMQVKRLRWKFRGNCTVVVDGMEVEVLWDVYNWLFGGGGASVRNAAVFMFRTCGKYSWPDSSSWSFSQRLLDSKSGTHDFSLVLYAWKERVNRHSSELCDS
ncbi:hypothetical protein LINGRAPRIM_LOCUS2964 [Linum grandiflorum]